MADGKRPAMALLIRDVALTHYNKAIADLTEEELGSVEDIAYQEYLTWKDGE